MGYTTQFEGVLRFGHEITIKEIVALGKILGEETRDHPEWGDCSATNYIALEMAPEYEGLQWCGGEKAYGMTEAVNLITRLMREINAEFRLEGEFLAQGGEISDRWKLALDETGHAKEVKISLDGAVMECPGCGHQWELESAPESGLTSAAVDRRPTSGPHSDGGAS